MDEIQLSSEEIELRLAEEIADNETTRATAREEPSQRKRRKNIDKHNAEVDIDGYNLCG